jgi:phosphoglycolate phosphatase
VALVVQWPCRYAQGKPPSPGWRFDCYEFSAYGARVLNVCALIFDLDGTLIDSVRDIGNACNAALLEQGYPVHSAARYPAFVGYGLQHLAGTALPPGQRSGAAIAALYARVTELYAGSAFATTRPYPGVTAALATLNRRGVPMAILSNKPHPACVAVVAGMFPSIRFAAVEGIRHGTPGKPDPAGAMRIALRLGLRPGEVAVVGDGDTDMAAARAAGMHAAGATWGYRSVRDLLAAGAERLLLRPYDSVGLIESRSGIR